MTATAPSEIGEASTVANQDTDRAHGRFTPTASEADWKTQGWAAESEPLLAAPRLGASISIRLDPDDTALVRRAARLSGVTKSEFVRRATLDEAAAVVSHAERAPIVVLSIRPLSSSVSTGSAPSDPPVDRQSVETNGSAITAA